MPLNLSGNKAPAPSERTVTTPGASITFSTHVGQSGIGDVPGLIIDARYYKDAAPEDTSLTQEQLRAITDSETLEDAVKEALNWNSDYLEAADEEGTNEGLALAGLRKEAFFGSIRANLSLTSLSVKDYPSARRLLKGLEEETYMGRYIPFEIAELDSYHPYTKPFDSGLRKLEALAPQGVERDNITHELDYIIDRKTQNGEVDVEEGDAENTLGLRVIDRGNQNQGISLAEDSTNPQRPTYVVINIHQHGLPAGFAEYAGQAVIRDGESFYFDGTDQLVPGELAAHLTEKSASGTLGLRPFEEDEDPRISFPYDWNRNNSIDVDPIDTSWWGHCHIEAPLASLGVSAGSDVTVFDARSKVMQTFGDTDVNDLLFAMLDATRYADMTTSAAVTVGKTTFVGNRNDTSESPLPGDKLIFQVLGRDYPFSISIMELFNPDDPTEFVDPDEIFSPTVITEGIRFEKNPAFRSLRDADWSTINGTRKIISWIEYMDVSSSGSVTRRSHEITIDPENPSREPVLLGSTVGRGEYPPSITKFYLNEVTGNLESRVFNPEKQEDDTWKTVAASEEATVIGLVSSRTLSQELKKESIIELHDHVLNAARRGVSFVTEEASGHAVWNYGTEGMRLNKLEQDGDFTRYSVTLETQGDPKEWEYILQTDADGAVIAAHALSEPADFVWRPERTVCMPLFRGEAGNLLYNSSASERGFLYDGEGRLSSEGMSFFRYASDVIYASLVKRRKHNQHVVISENGELYFYDDIGSYKTDVTALGGNPTGLTGPRRGVLHRRNVSHSFRSPVSQSPWNR